MVAILFITCAQNIRPFLFGVPSNNGPEHEAMLSSLFDCSRPCGIC